MLTAAVQISPTISNKDGILPRLVKVAQGKGSSQCKHSLEVSPRPM